LSQKNFTLQRANRIPMNLPPINTELLIEYLTGLLNTASPTGFTHHAIEYAHNAFQAYAELGLSLSR